MSTRMGPARKLHYDRVFLNGIERFAHAFHAQLDAVRGTQVDNEQVIFAPVDHPAEMVLHAKPLLRGKAAMKDRQLEPFSEPFHGPVHFTPALWVPDIIADQISMLHGNHRVRKLGYLGISPAK